MSGRTTSAARFAPESAERHGRAWHVEKYGYQFQKVCRVGAANVPPVRQTRFPADR